MKKEHLDFVDIKWDLIKFKTNYNNFILYCQLNEFFLNEYIIKKIKYIILYIDYLLEK